MEQEPLLDMEWVRQELRKPVTSSMRLVQRLVDRLGNAPRALAQDTAPLKRHFAPADDQPLRDIGDITMEN